MSHSLVSTLSLDSYTIDSTNDVVPENLQQSLIISTHDGITYKRGLDERICPHFFALNDLKDFSIVSDNSRDALYYRYKVGFEKWRKTNGVNIPLMNIIGQLIVILGIIYYPLVTAIPLLIGKYGLGQNVQYINVNGKNTVARIKQRLKRQSVLVYLTKYTVGRGLYYIIKETKCPIHFVQIYQKSNGEFAMQARQYNRNEISFDLPPDEFMKRLKESLYRINSTLSE